MTMKLLIATHNPGKLREYADLLAGLPLTLVSPDALSIDLDVTESGATYLENARLKAAAYSRTSGLLTLADDSGLEVDILDGAPGVHSARYASGDDADRISALLRALDASGAAPQERSAHFRCVIVLTDPNGEMWSTTGECAGMIISSPRGSEGFGYDPVFLFPDLGRTMAELQPKEKNRISHRARAALALRPILDRLSSKANAG
jgi:XTP/dITP diphosphohydrolase